MSVIDQIRDLVMIAIAGYVMVMLAFIPAFRRAWRKRSVAGGFVIALGFANGWLLIYLALLLTAYYRPQWIPGHTSQVLALSVAIEPWVQLVWFLHWRHSVNTRIETSDPSHEEQQS